MRWRWVGLVAVLPWVVVGCGDQPRVTGASARAASDSHPFVVGEVPDGYRPVTAGRGTAMQLWGEDSNGTDEPFTVLEGDGDAVMLVSVTGFEGYEGGLSQASGRFSDAQQADEIELDGSQAIFVPATNDGWADLVVVRGPDLAVRVTAPGATKDELVEVARRVEPAADHARAPAVTDPPPPWRVTGSVDADAVVALQAYVQANSDFVPGPQSAYGAGWLSAEGWLAVMSLPGDIADVDALLSLRTPFYGREVTRRTVEVEGRQAVLLELCDCRPGSESYRTRAVFAPDGPGAMTVVVATGLRIPDADALVDVAASVRVAGAAEWERFTIQSTGGPGLHPDEGEVELARGHEAGLDWLLQTSPEPQDGQLVDPSASPGVDPCLKLSNRKRACARSGGGGSGEFVFTSSNGAPDPAAPELPSMVIVVTQHEGATVRVRTPTDTGTGSLHAIPDGGGWTGVVFVDDPYLATCPGDPLPPGLEDVTRKLMQVDVLDASGDVVACLR